MSTSPETSSALRNQSRAVEAKLAERVENEVPAEEMQRVNFEVSRSKRVKLKILAAKRGQSVKEFLTEYIDSFPDE